MGRFPRSCRLIEAADLRVHLGFSTQRESSQAALLCVSEHRFDHAHALGMDRAAFDAVDFSTHRTAVRIG